MGLRHGSGKTGTGQLFQQRRFDDLLSCSLQYWLDHRRRLSCHCLRLGLHFVWQGGNSGRVRSYGRLPLAGKGRLGKQALHSRCSSLDYRHLRLAIHLGFALLVHLAHRGPAFFLLQHRQGSRTIRHGRRCQLILPLRLQQRRGGDHGCFVRYFHFGFVQAVDIAQTGPVLFLTLCSDSARQIGHG
ncbi:hypothetical protein, partial [Aquitalea magnusonii]|uniref:hypothetical protein n=1 Tax=Aquitalea magnusonii TaxID=332411 RepID=UPI00195F0BA5